MPRKPEHVPFQAFLVLPLAPLAESAAHEEKLLAGMRLHVTEEQAQVCRLLPFVARQLADQRAFPVNDFVKAPG